MTLDLTSEEFRAKAGGVTPRSWTTSGTQRSAAPTSRP